MRSFVLWYENKIESIKNKPKNKIKNEQRVHLDVHVNQWQYLKNRKRNYFDFGFLVKDISNISNIFFFLPFAKDNVKVSDLCEKICGSEQARLVNAIFNESYRISCIENPKSTKIKRKVREPNEEFIVYSLSEAQLSVSSESEGSLVKIDLRDINLHGGPREYYFRFRIEISDGQSVIKRGISETSFLQTLFTKVEVIDFRFNDVRSSVKNVVEKYLDGKHFNIRKLHYLILRNEKDEFLFHGGGVSSRVLEDELWHDYFVTKENENGSKNKFFGSIFKSKKDDANDVIAYHLKKKAKSSDDEIESFTRLVRFRYRAKSLKSILYFAIWTFFIIFASAIVCIWLDKCYKLFQ